LILYFDIKNEFIHIIFVVGIELSILGKRRSFILKPSWTGRQQITEK